MCDEGIEQKTVTPIIIQPRCDSSVFEPEADGRSAEIPVIIQPRCDDRSVCKAELKTEEDDKNNVGIPNIIQPEGGDCLDCKAQVKIEDDKQKPPRVVDEDSSFTFWKNDFSSNDVWTEKKELKKMYMCPLCSYKSCEWPQVEQHRWKCHDTPIPQDKTDKMARVELVHCKVEENGDNFKSMTQSSRRTEQTFNEVMSQELPSLVATGVTSEHEEESLPITFKKKSKMNSTKKKKIYECPVCKKSFIYKRRLETHKLTKHKRKKKHNKCGICKVVFKTKWEAEYHAVTHKDSAVGKKAAICQRNARRYKMDDETEEGPTSHETNAHMGMMYETGEKPTLFKQHQQKNKLKQKKRQACSSEQDESYFDQITETGHCVNFQQPEEQSEVGCNETIVEESGEWAVKSNRLEKSEPKKVDEIIKKPDQRSDTNKKVVDKSLFEHSIMDEPSKDNANDFKESFVEIFDKTGKLCFVNYDACREIQPQLNNETLESAELRNLMSGTKHEVDCDVNAAIKEFDLQCKLVQNDKTGNQSFQGEDGKHTVEVNKLMMENFEATSQVISIDDKAVLENQMKLSECADPHECFVNMPQLKDVHSTDKSHRCTVCRIDFKTATDLHQHFCVLHFSNQPNTCYICNKEFAKAPSLMYHMLTIHNNNRPYKCTVCGKAFKTSAHLKVHKSDVHTTERPYKCNVCNNAFKRAPLLKRHIWIVHSNKRPYECTVCGKAFTTSTSLKIHKSYVHTTERPHKCNVCNKGFKRPDLLRNHMLIVHSNKRPYECTVCGKAFKTSKSLKEHKSDVHATERPHICNVCNKGFTRAPLLKKHLLIVHSNKRPYECTVCGKAFKTSRTLKVHKTYVHTSERPYKCNVCNKGFKRAPLLRSHMLFVHSNKRLYECTVCGKAFKTSTSLKSDVDTSERKYKCTVCNRAFETTFHMVHIDSTEKPCKCPDCKMVFKTASQLKAHTCKVIHKSKKTESYECDICSKKFKSKVGWSQHVKRHTGQRELYECTECGKKLSSATGLHYHLKSHSNETPYQCDVCDVRFTHRYQLNDHKMKVHVLGGRPLYQCPICQKGFFQKHNLLTHQRIHSNVKPFKCDICDASFNHKIGLKNHNNQKHSSNNQKHSSITKIPQPQVQLCFVCGLSLSSERSLNLHISRIHKNERAYICTTCGHRCFRKCELTLHNQRVHSEGQPMRKHSCTVCEKRFLTSSELRTHLKRHDKDSWKHQCEICEKRFLQKFELNRHMNSHSNLQLKTNLQHSLDDGKKRPFVCQVCGASYTQNQSLKEHNEVKHLGLERAHRCMISNCNMLFMRKRQLKRHQKAVHKTTIS